MKQSWCVLILAGIGTAAPAASGATMEAASFHLMQIEQVIGGVEGDTSIQAIQLRQRTIFQNSVSGTSLWVRNATGGSPVRLINFPGSVANGATGARILVGSLTFSERLDTGATPDFVFENLIPDAYLAGGSLTFEDGIGTIYWRVSWGNYTGPTTGSPTNDADGDFGGPVTMPLPSQSLQALRFTGTASALSTSNENDYELTSGASTWTNNSGLSGTLVSGGGETCTADISGDGGVGVPDLLILLAAWGPCGIPCSADLSGNNMVDVPDLLALLAAWGPCP